MLDSVNKSQTQGRLFLLLVIIYLNRWEETGSDRNRWKSAMSGSIPATSISRRKAESTKVYQSQLDTLPKIQFQDTTESNAKIGN